MTRFLSLPLILLLSGCSSDPERTTLDTVGSYFAPGEYIPSPRFSELLTEPRPILDIELIDLGVAGKLILEQQDGDYARYLSADLGGIVLQNGMLHSIYGFGEPLVGAELSQPLALVLAGRTGTSDRFHTYLNGEDRAVRRTFRCEIGVREFQDVELTTGKISTLLMSEACESLASSFENFYWVDLRRREIIQSRQWVGDNVGAMVTRVTRPL